MRLLGLKPTDYRFIRLLLWIYFLSILFDGAIRKWFLPGLSTPLLALRDPIAIMVLFKGYPLLTSRRCRSWLQPLLLISFISIFSSLIFGHGDIVTALWGVRILLIHLPLIFLIPSVFNLYDVITFCKFMACICIPMTILVYLQSSLPPLHPLNIGLGGAGSSVFGGLDFRPSGTFSFTNGLANFYQLAFACFFVLLYANTKLSTFMEFVCFFCAVSLVVAVPFSLSRAVLFSYILTMIFVFGALILSRVRVGKLLIGIVSLGLAFSLALSTPAFADRYSAFVNRWESASAVESSEGDPLEVINTRIFGRVLSSFDNSSQYPLLGLGIGTGTNVGALRISGDTTAFLLSDSPWEQIFGELGLPLGSLYILWRLCFSVSLLRLSLKSAISANPAPLILYSSAVYHILFSTGGQATTLGFIILTAGLSMAANNTMGARSYANCLRATVIPNKYVATSHRTA